MKPVRVWPDLTTGKFWHKDEETDVVTEITGLPNTSTMPTAAEVKTRMIAMELRIR